MPVFSLEEARVLQVKNISQNTFKYWSESATYGYFGGGYLPPPAASHGALTSGWDGTIISIDYSNENVSQIDNNLPSLTDAAAVSNNSYGYFSGGSGPPGQTLSCTIIRLDLSNNSISNPGKNLPTSRSLLVATSSTSYGYFGGGFSPPYICTITRLDFSNETVSDPGKNLPSIRASLAAVSSSSYGYFGGGYEPSITNKISRLDFSNETVSDPGNNLPTERSSLAAVSSNSYGYFGGGFSPPYICTITRLDFSNETVSDPGKNLPSIRSNLAAVSSSSYGYFGGGISVNYFTYICTISRLDFSNETVSNPGKNWPRKRRGVATFSGGTSLTRPVKSFGYFCGGYYRNVSPTALSTRPTSKLDFSTENVSVASGSASWGSAGVTNNNRGYVANGLPESSVRSIDFNTSTTSLPGKNLPYSRQYSMGSSSNSYGYFSGGGYVSGNYWDTYSAVNIISRLDFSNETASNPGNNLLTVRSQSTATSNSNYMYLGGGYFINTITRLDFSSETVSDPGKDLPTARRNLSSVSNNLYGYFGTGDIPSSPYPSISGTLEKLDFSTENISLLPAVASGSSDNAAVSSSFHGYFGGGFFSGLSVAYQSCTITRLDFSNETVSDPGNNLPFRTRANTGLSN